MNHLVSKFFLALAFQSQNFSYALSCFQVLLKKNYELIHTHDPASLYAAVMVKRKRGTPIIAMFHGPPNFPVFLWSGQSVHARIKFMKKVLQRVNIVVSTGDAADSIKRDFQIDAERIDPGVNPNIFKFEHNERIRIRKRLDLTESDKVIIFVGSLISVKNVSFQLHILKEIVETIKNVKLLIVGDGFLKPKLEIEAQKMKLDNHVIFAGRVPHNNVQKFYSAGDIFLLTSYYECFPTVILEALSCELPVVSTNVGGVHYIIEDKKTGFLFDLTQKEKMVECLIQLMENEDLRIKVGKAGRKNVKKYHTWEKSAKKYKQLYESLNV